jgi:hypothetical protein
MITRAEAYISLDAPDKALKFLESEFPGDFVHVKRYQRLVCYAMDTLANKLTQKAKLKEALDLYSNLLSHQRNYSGSYPAVALLRVMFKRAAILYSLNKDQTTLSSLNQYLQYRKDLFADATAGDTGTPISSVEALNSMRSEQDDVDWRDACGMRFRVLLDLAKGYSAKRAWGDVLQTLESVAYYFTLEKCIRFNSL